MKKKILKYSLSFTALFLLILWYLSTTINFEKRFAYILYADGEIINAQVSDDQQWRIKCEDELPEKLVTSLKLFEDQYFNYHPGINPVSIVKAMKANIKARKIIRGGSTITMQLARIHEGNQRRTYVQKCKEIFLAFALELKYSKKELLKLYAQYAPYGGNTVGYCAAAQRYYHKDAALLSWSEAATLAILPNAPSKIYPGKAQEQLVRKRNFLLQKLLAKQLIDSVSCRLAMLEDLPQQSHSFHALAPQLLQELKKETTEHYNFNTTIDYSLQKNAMRIVQSYRDQYANEGIDNMAALVLRNEGSVAAYVANVFCGKDCAAEVDLLKAARSPGSTLKPFLYGVAMDVGLLTRTSLMKDIPIFYNGYTPRNFDMKHRGVVDAERALTQSLNIPAVDLLAEYGTAAFLTDLQKMQFHTIDKSPDHYGLTLILGGSEVTSIELAKSYMNLSRVAQGKPAISIKQLEFQEQETVAHFPLSQGAAYNILEMLKGVNRPQSEQGWQYFSGVKEVSWKTGTSFGFRDAWAVGTTADYTVLVWVGNADGEGKSSLLGVAKAAPVMFDIFDLLPMDKTLPLPRQALEVKYVCASSGQLPGDACANTVPIHHPIHAKNPEVCTYHKFVTLDESEAYRVYQHCDESAITKATFVLEPLVDSYYEKFSGLSHQLPPFHPSCSSMATDLKIIYPSSNAEILLPKDIDDRKQSLVGKALAGAEADSLFWFVDHELISITSQEHKVALDLEVGEHVLTVVASSGGEDSHRFWVVK